MALEELDRLGEKVIEGFHIPMINKFPVIKINLNLYYALL
jgi:hypothetical protein